MSEYRVVEVLDPRDPDLHRSFDPAEVETVYLLHGAAEVTVPQVLGAFFIMAEGQAVAFPVGTMILTPTESGGKTAVRDFVAWLKSHVSVPVYLLCAPATVARSVLRLDATIQMADMSPCEHSQVADLFDQQVLRALPPRRR